MRYLTLAALGLAVLLSGCSGSKDQPTSTAESTQTSPSLGKAEGATLDDFRVGEPVTHENLTVFPVITTIAKTDDRFITLQDGLKAGKVEIFEVGAAQRGEQVADGDDIEVESQASTDALVQQAPQQIVAFDGVAGDVGTLMVVNRSEKSLYLMPGQIIVGGKQDRTIAQETFIPPGDEPVSLDVFCVEQGRWSGRSTAETVDLLACPSDETGTTDTAKAGQGQFVATVGNLNKSSRLALQASQDQHEVWRRVAEENAKSGAAMASNAFTSNYVQTDIVEKLDPYIAAIAQPVAERQRVVGVIVAVNGKPEAMDVFESTPLFLKLWPTLLKSYALDAANAATEEDAKEPCSVEQATAFLREAVEAGVEEQRSEGDVHLAKRTSERVVGFQGALGGGGLGGGGLGGAHGAFFAK